MSFGEGNLHEAIKKRDELIRDMLQEIQCKRSCADCPHEEDEGCEFMSRSIELGVIEPLVDSRKPGRVFPDVTRPLCERIEVSA